MRNLIAPALFASVVLSAPAFANETEDFCNAFASDHDLSTQPCSCIGEVADANPDVKEAVLALTDPSETDAWDDSIKQKLGVCFPQESQ